MGPGARGARQTGPAEICQKKAGDLSREASQGSGDGCRPRRDPHSKSLGRTTTGIAAAGLARQTARGTPLRHVGPVSSTAKGWRAETSAMAAVARAALPRLARALAAPARSHARAMSSVVELSSYLEKF